MTKSEYQGETNYNENIDKNLLTVKETANVIDETPNIVRNWMKELRQYIPLKKNESGYNVFDDQALERMKLIKELHRERNYSIKQIEHYLATDGQDYQPVPEKKAEELLAEEIKGLKDQVQELQEYSQKQEQFNQALIEKLDQQKQYINEKLSERDTNLLSTLREMQESKQIASTDYEEPEKKKGFFAKLFGK